MYQQQPALRSWRLLPLSKVSCECRQIYTKLTSLRKDGDSVTIEFDTDKPILHQERHIEQFLHRLTKRLWIDRKVE